jgi:flagella basal body P-ring formation protein FlgA
MKFLLPKSVLVLALGLAMIGPVAAAELDTELVRAAIVEAARASLPDTVVSVSVRGVQVRGNVDIAAGAPVEVVIHAQGDEDWIGRLSAEAEVFAGGKLIRTVRILATVIAQVKVAVLRNPVARGQVIRATDIGEALREADRLPSGVIMRPAALVGRTAKRDLGLNRLVTEGELLERTDAQRNRPVTLVVRNGGLLITSPGILRKDARIGDLVEVLSTATRGIVFGILINPDVVEVPTIASVTSHSLSLR